MRLRLLASVALVTLAVVAPAGAATPAEMVNASLTAAEGARTVHIVASGLQASQPLSFDLHLVAGKGGKGTLNQGGLPFAIVRIGPNAYFKGGDAFLKRYAGATVSELLKGRWFKASATKGQFAAFTPLTDIKLLFSAILGSHGKLELGRRGAIGGVPAVAIVDTSKNGGGTLWIAAKGPPYPLELTQTGGTGVIRFKDWNKPVSITAPKKALDYDKLTKHK